VEPRPSSPSAGEELPPRPLTHHLALTVYLLSNTLLWGALLHIGFHSRLAEWFGEAKVGFHFALLGLAGGTVGAITQPLIGALSDRSLNRWGRRRPYIVLFSALAIVAILLLGASKSFWPLLGALVLVELFTNAALGPFTALLPDTVNPCEHGKASGFLGLARLLGDWGGLVLATLILTWHAPREADQAATVAFNNGRWLLLSAVLAAVMLAGVVYTCWAIGERRLDRQPERSTWSSLKQSYAFDVKTNSDFFWLSISRAFTNLGFFLFLESLPYFVRYTLGYPDPQWKTQSLLVILPAIAMAALSSIPSGVLSDRIGRRPLIFAGQLLMAAGAFGFVLAPNATIATIAGLPAGLGYGLFMAVEWAFACNLLPRAEAGRYLGLWNASCVVPQILAFPGAFIVGSAVAAIRPGLGWRIDFGIALVCCLVGTYFLVKVRERRTREEQPTPTLGC